MSLLASCLVTLFDLASPSFRLQQSWVLVSKELISLLHLSLLHLEEDKTTVSQEVSSIKVKAEASGGTESQKGNQTGSDSCLVVSACRNLGLLLFRCVEEIEGKAPEPQSRNGGSKAQRGNGPPRQGCGKGSGFCSWIWEVSFSGFLQERKFT